MTGNRFAALVKAIFNLFMCDLGFKAEKPHLSGRYYRASFVGNKHTLVVLFEPGDDYLTTMLVCNDDNDLAAIDDPQRTPRLADLNRRYMNEVSQQDRQANDAYFSSINVVGRKEQELLKCAKDLRLVLPRHLLALN